MQFKRHSHSNKWVNQSPRIKSPQSWWDSRLMTHTTTQPLIWPFNDTGHLWQLTNWQSSFPALTQSWWPQYYIGLHFAKDPLTLHRILSFWGPKWKKDFRHNNFSTLFTTLTFLNSSTKNATLLWSPFSKVLKPWVTQLLRPTSCLSPFLVEWKNQIDGLDLDLVQQ